MNLLRLSAYGALGFPLAFVALSAYVVVPHFYSTQVAVSLNIVGVVLLLTRLVDGLLDPWLGRFSGRIDALGGLPLALCVAAALLALGYSLLWVPPSGALAAFWMSACLLLTCLGHSVLNISLLAWGGQISRDPGVLTQASLWREGFGLAGVVCAAVLAGMSAGEGKTWSVVAVCASLLLGLLLLLTLAPSRVLPALGANAALPWWRQLRRNPTTLRLLLAYTVSAAGSALAATLAAFYIADHLHAETSTGWFLATYFIAGALALPLWGWLAARLGANVAWRVGMVTASLAFCWAAWLPPGSVSVYWFICVLAGMSLGADLALPPVVLVSTLPRQSSMATWFGVWSLLTKLSLAFAGLALPALGLAGYVPGTGGGWMLPFAYAGIPCLLKLLAVLLAHQPAAIQNQVTEGLEV